MGSWGLFPGRRNRIECHIGIKSKLNRKVQWAWDWEGKAQERIQERTVNTKGESLKSKYLDLKQVYDF